MVLEKWYWNICFVLKGILPHIGSAEVQTRTDMATMAAKNLVAALTGEKMLAEYPLWECCFCLLENILFNIYI